MRGCILQPGYLPWLGFFEQYIFSEIFIFLDDVQYTKQDWRNRNKIRTSSQNGWDYLTVPVQYENVYTLIKDIKINYSVNWVKKHLNKIRENYLKSPFFNEVYPIIENQLNKKHIFLKDLDINLINDIADYLNISRKCVCSSELKVSSLDKNERLIEICRHYGIDYFYDGAVAENFIIREKWLAHNIKVEFQRYNHPVYKQIKEPFIPFLSIVDLLFNCGKQSANLIVTNKNILKLNL